MEDGVKAFDTSEPSADMVKSCTLSGTSRFGLTRKAIRVPSGRPYRVVVVVAGPRKPLWRSTVDPYGGDLVVECFTVVRIDLHLLAVSAPWGNADTHTRYRQSGSRLGTGRRRSRKEIRPMGSHRRWSALESPRHLRY